MYYTNADVNAGLARLVEICSCANLAHWAAREGRRMDRRSDSSLAPAQPVFVATGTAIT
jgi:hypothetical protein